MNLIYGQANFNECLAQRMYQDQYPIFFDALPASYHHGEYRSTAAGDRIHLNSEAQERSVRTPETEN